MKRMFLGLALATSPMLTASGALADGMPKAHSVRTSPCASFAGYYVGAHVGSVTYDTAWTDRDNWADRFGVDIGLDHVARSQTDLGAGLQAGYNLQRGCTIIGFEADWTWTNAGDSRNYTGNGIPADMVINLDDEVKWFGTLRTRSGVVVDNLFLFVTGGLAYADIKHNWRLTDGPVTERFSASDTKWGWTLGVGTEWAWSDRVSLKTEALYIHFDDESTRVFSPAAGTNVNFDHQDSMWVARVGLNIKLGDRRISEGPLK
jgi:outer membrane immunogenic protein